MRNTRHVLGGLALGVIALLLTVGVVYVTLVNCLPDVWLNLQLVDAHPESRQVALWSFAAGLSGILAALAWRRVSAPFSIGYTIGFLTGLLVLEWIAVGIGNMFSTNPQPFAPDHRLYAPTLLSLAVTSVALEARAAAKARVSETQAAASAGAGLGLVEIGTGLLIATGALVLPVCWWFGSSLAAADNQAAARTTSGAGTIGTREDPTSLWSGTIRCQWPSGPEDWMSISGFDYPLPALGGDRVIGVKVGGYVEVRTDDQPPLLSSAGDWRDFEGVAPDEGSGAVVLADTRPDTVITWDCDSVPGRARVRDPAPSATARSVPASQPAQETAQHLTITIGGIAVRPQSIPAGPAGFTATLDLGSAIAGQQCGERPPPCRVDDNVYLMLLGPVTPGQVERLAQGDIDWREDLFGDYAVGTPGIVAIGWDLEASGDQDVGGVALGPGVYAWVTLDPLLFATFAVE